MAKVPTHTHTHTHFLPTTTTTPSLQEQRSKRSQLRSQRPNSTEAPVRSGVRLCSQAQSQMTNTEKLGHHLLKLGPPKPVQVRVGRMAGVGDLEHTQDRAGEGRGQPCLGRTTLHPWPDLRAAEGPRQSQKEYPSQDSQLGKGAEPQTAAVQPVPLRGLSPPPGPGAHPSGDAEPARAIEPRVPAGWPAEALTPPGARVRLSGVRAEASSASRAIGANKAQRRPQGRPRAGTSEPEGPSPDLGSSPRPQRALGGIRLRQ